MKKLIILLFLMPLLSFGQDKVKGYVSISEEYKSFYFLNSNIMTGVSIPIEKTTLSVYGEFQLEGNVKMKNKYKHNDYDIINPYRMQNYFLGAGLKFRFRHTEKIYSPVLASSISTEVYSNYKGEKIHTYRDHSYNYNKKKYYFSPTNRPAKNYTKSTGEPSMDVTGYYTYYYISTPIIGSVMLENEFKIIGRLTFSIGVGYAYRKVRLGFKSWGVNEQEPLSGISNHKISPSLVRNNWRHYFNFNISCNYTFSFKNK